MFIRDRIRELRRVPASQLRPNPKNWRNHPPAQRDALKGLLAELGYCDALLVRELADGSLELIDGHLRAETTPDLDVPVLVLDVTAEEADKLLLTLDPLASLAEANAEALTSLLASVDTDSEAVRALLAELAAGELTRFPEPEPLQGLTDPDAIPEPADEPTTRPGDLWIVGDHRLLCADAGKPEHLDRLLDGAPVHLANMDPPYGVRVEPRTNNAIASGLSSFQGTTHHQGLDLARHPKKAKPTGKKLRARDRLRKRLTSNPRVTYHFGMVATAGKPVQRADADDDLFKAIADPSRRKILHLLAAGELRLKAIEEHFTISRPALLKHLRVLRSCRLVQVHKQGRETIHRLDSRPLRAIKYWVARLELRWDDHLNRLKRQVEADS
jgi:DNA-binding transcriptional ArsR family regulator